MRLRLDATPEELKDKGPELIKALAHEVKEANPELAQNLEKALPKKEPALKYPMLRDLHAGNRKEYRETLDDMVQGIQDILENPQLQKAKISKAAVMYLHVLDTQYECRDCNMFIPDKQRCTVHLPGEVIRAHGSCGLFHPGKPMKGAESHGKYSKQDTGYDENPHQQGFSCKRCEHFRGAVAGGTKGSISPRGDCTLVDKDSPGDDAGNIHPDACCNAQALDEQRAQLPAESRLNKGGLIPESAVEQAVQAASHVNEILREWQNPVPYAMPATFPEDFQKSPGVPLFGEQNEQKRSARGHGLSTRPLPPMTKAEGEEEPEEPGTEPPDPDYDPESGEPIIDPQTGLTPSETEEARAAGELDEEETDTEKSVDSNLESMVLSGWLKGVTPMSDSEFVQLWDGGPLRKARKTKKNPHGGPFVGPRGGLWADPKHTIHWDPAKHGKVPVKVARLAAEKEQDDGTRYGDDEAKAALTRMGDRLHAIQSADPFSEDQSGFSRMDMQNWMSARGNALKMRQLLKKYKRQLMGPEYWKAGLGDQLANLAVRFQIHPSFGSLNIHIDGYIKSKEAWWAQHNMHKELGMWRDRASGAYVLKNPEGFDYEAYQRRLKEVLPDLVLDFGEPPKVATPEDREAERDKLKQELASAASPVDLVWGRLAEGTANNVAGVKWHAEEGTFEFRFPKGKVSTLFSNRRGGLPTVTWWDQSTRPWAVRVFDVDTACLAIKRIKELYPDWEIATEGMEEAIKARDAQRAKNEVPIPEVAEHLAPGYSLFPYQNEGVRFLLNSIDPAKKGGAMLGDEMGLGKTLQMLAYAVARKQRMVVICPKTVRRTWLQEAAKFFPEQFTGKELDSSQLLKAKRKLGADATPEAIVEALGLDKVNLATINYESIAKFEPILRAAGFDIMVMDESHRMKNPKAKLTTAINKLGEAVTTRILLSGTAIKNKKEEFATQFEVVRPGLFQKITVRDKFGRSHQISEIRRKTIGELWHRMRPFYLARQKDTVLKDLPPKTLQVSMQEVALAPDIPFNADSIIKNAQFFAFAEARDAGESEAQAKVLGEMAADEMRAQIDELRADWSEAGHQGEDIQSWDKVLRDFGLRQISSSGTTVGAYSRIKSALAQAKTPATKQLVDEILEGSDSNILVFTNSKGAVRELKRIYGDNAVTHYGPDSHEKREKAKALFHPDTRPEGDETPRILIGTMDTLREGATLTSADKVVFNDLPWTAMEFRQAEARAHRPGQDKPVDVFWVTAEGNQMDQAITKLLKYKIDLTKKANEGRRLSAEEQAALDTDISLEAVLSEMRGAPTVPEKSAVRETVKTSEGERTVTTTKQPEVVAQEPVGKKPTKKLPSARVKDIDKPAPKQKAPTKTPDVPEVKPVVQTPVQGPSIAETNAKAAAQLPGLPKEVKGLMVALHRLESRGEVALKTTTPGLTKQLKAFMEANRESGIAGGEIIRWEDGRWSYDSPAGSLLLHPDPRGRKPYVSYTSQTTRVREGAPAPESSEKTLPKGVPPKGAQLKLFKALWLAGYDEDDSEAILERLVNEGPFVDDLGEPYMDPQHRVPWESGLGEELQSEEIAGYIIAGDTIGTLDGLTKTQDAHSLGTTNLEKARPLDEPLAFDPTADIVEQEQWLYDRVKKLVKRRLEDPPTDADFEEPGGRFYGWSTNELLTHLQAQRQT